MNYERFNYRFFLFNKLADIYFPSEFVDYDVLFEKRVDLFDKYNAHETNDSNRNEYQCMEDFLKTQLS